MRERQKKPTLEQIRTLFPFDPALLAARAGIPTTAVYHALVMHPIPHAYVEKILEVLSQHTGLQLTREKVDIATWEMFDMLWIIRASANGGPNEREEAEDRYHFIYARDREHAATFCHEWFESFSQLPHHFFTACPDGFQVSDIVVPGRYQIETDE